MITRLSDRAASRAVLVGVHSYAGDGGLAQLPAVERNIAALRDALCDKQVWGLAESDCQALGPEVNPGAVMTAIDHAVRQATDTLLVYYAGHGLLHPDRSTDLHLALHDSNDHQMWRSVPYVHIRDEVRAAHRRKGLKCAIVLDCCFSGAAVEGGMGRPEALLQRVSDIDGVCVLTSSAATELAFSPPDEELSVFTGALLGLLRSGLPEAGPVLDFGTLHACLQQELGARDQPQHPQLGTHNSGERIAIFRNSAYLPRTDTGRGPEAPLPTEPLFGRDRELRELAALTASDPGVLVLHGPPGVGKSALAAELYRRLTAESDTRPVVLLDNLTDATEVARAVASAPHALFLVTSRSSLTEVAAHRYALTPLELGHAVAMLQDLSGLAGHDAELTEIARLLSCFPLALRPVAARLRRTPPDLLLDAMRESERPLQHLHSDDNEVRKAFAVSYDVLTEPQKQVLHDCACHPGPDFDRYSASALSRMPPGICGLMLVELVDAGLLQRADGRYAFHDLYRSYSRLTPDEEALRRTWLYQHLRRALRDARRDDAWKAWRGAALSELRATARVAREDVWHLATELSCEVADALREEQQFAEAKEEADIAYRYAAGLRDGRAIVRARGCLALLGEVTRPGQVPPGQGPPGQRPPGHVPAVRKELAKELDHAAQAAGVLAEPPAERGRRLMYLAERALAAGLVEEAMRYQADASVLLEETSDADLLAECLVGQAALAIYTRQHTQAAEFAQEAARLLDEQDDQEGAAHAYATVAEALRKSGELGPAARYSRLALDRFTLVDDPAALGYALRLAAKIAWAQGGHSEARRLMQKAQEVHRVSGAEEGPSTRAIAHPSRSHSAEWSEPERPPLFKQ
ncbi:AAA family ATPase [Streptomyces niveus]|uniref:caspase, EACC1-associated type n=1 Tax=Streptomyces niveus TaxID=193462 RepID=UPI00367BAF07